jgi:hypothetical protein
MAPRRKQGKPDSFAEGGEVAKKMRIVDGGYGKDGWPPFQAAPIEDRATTRAIGSGPMTHFLSGDHELSK